MTDLAAIEARLRRQEDITAICMAKARYFRCLDTKDWAGLREVFTEDGSMDMREPSSSMQEDQLGASSDTMLVQGADNVIAFVSGWMESAASAHHGHMPEIEFVSDDEARCIWAMEDIVHMAPGAPMTKVHGRGHYHDTFVREADGRWRIKSLRLTRLMSSAS